MGAPSARERKGTKKKTKTKNEYKHESRKAINKETPHTLNLDSQQIDDCVDAPHDKNSWNINLTLSLSYVFIWILLNFCFHHVAIIYFWQHLASRNNIWALKFIHSPSGVNEAAIASVLKIVSIVEYVLRKRRIIQPPGYAPHRIYNVLNAYVIYVEKPARNVL